MKNHVVILLLLIQVNLFAQDLGKIKVEQGVEAMLKNDYEKSLGLLLEAKSIATQNDNYENLFLAINNIGANYYSMLDYGEALSNYLEAYQIAIDYLEPKHEMSVLNNIAILYSKEENFDKAIEYFQKAYDIASKNKELPKKGLYAINLGAAHNEINKTSIARKFIDESISIFKDDSKMLLDAKLILSNNLMLSGENDAAINLSLELEALLIGKEYIEHRISNYLIISNAYQQKGNIERAVFYAKRALNEDKNIEDKISVYEQLAELYITQGKLEEALSVKDSLFNAEKELNAIKNGRLFESKKVKFEVENYQRELKYQQEEIKNQEKQFLILLIGSIIILIVFIWALRNSYVKSKQKKKLHEKAQELISLELEKEKTTKLLLEKQLKEKEAISLFQQEKLKNEIESKNRKLSAKALYLSNKNTLIASIISDLEKIYHVRRDPELKNHILSLKDLLKTDDEWDSFVKHFEEVNHGFIDKLKHEFPILNTNDIRFLSYVYMNLSIKEISQIFNITHEACRKRKERVSKKLKLKASSDLHDFLYVFN
ncbi:tetratricopeptide repeat protein [Pontimicrobium sp. IMCC45349]|uniref:tetratricopeptide repeat protein n=1 Tax=Pontimicrobium sp. IMCC45349 TaxID=3391574 RepID=UPI00399EF08D